MPQFTETEYALRIDLAAAFQLAVMHDLYEGIANHFSVLLPDGEHFLVNPFGVHFAELSASRLLVCDRDGRVVRGEGKPSPSALHIHAEIHRRVARARVVLHTHQPYATALTLIREGRIEWVSQTACRFYGRVAYDRDYDGVALDASVGERLAAQLGDADLLMMGNHGVLTVAPTVAQAYDDLYFLERVAKTQILALSTGQPLVTLAPELVEMVARQTHHERFDLGYIEAHFAALKRLLDRAGVAYRD